ncbi:hypothetical protein B0A69_01300 [Chryseobacterium shigense]|nr:hypothetical protein B0A69_01300 [Chryseobacterium shigense]
MPENRNEQASLPEKFNFKEMKLKAITTFIHPENHTTSTLYGNENAYNALLHSDSTPSNSSKNLVLITWKLQDDPKWFGAKILGSLVSIETLKTNTNFKDLQNITYEFLPGGHLEKNIPASDNGKRIKDILAVQPAVMP